jgi:hypothetical protein
MLVNGSILLISEDFNIYTCWGGGGIINIYLERERERQRTSPHLFVPHQCRIQSLCLNVRVGIYIFFCFIVICYGPA